jgi:cell division protein FtsI (penicillin-binding protein 3)
MALDTHTTTLAGSYDAAHAITIGRFTINDYHPMHRALTVPEIFEYSSNIGAARMALDAGSDRLREFLGRLGLLRAARIEIPEIGAPQVPSPWLEVSTMTVAFGHGISVSPLQVAVAASAVVNGGVLRQPTIIKRQPGARVMGEQVMAPATSEEMRRLFRLVVEKGTGTMAAAPGYLVGGKTGTAEKASAHGYQRHELLSSFVGAFPINDPRYLVMAIIDEPHGNAKSHGFATAGWTAAPVVGRSIQRMAPLLGVKPVDESDPEIERALLIQSPGELVRKLASN